MRIATSLYYVFLFTSIFNATFLSGGYIPNNIFLRNVYFSRKKEMRVYKIK